MTTTTAPRLRALALCALLARASTARAASATTAAPPLPLRDLQYAHRPVGFDGGGWVTGLVAHAATGIVYARTDVGSAPVARTRKHRAVRAGQCLGAAG